MRKPLLLAFALALLLPLSMRAQVLADYTFSTGTDSSLWVDMSSATTQPWTTTGDYGLTAVHNIGFAFPFGEATFTQYSVNSDGNLRLGSTLTGTSNYSTPFSSANASVNNPKINVFGCDGYAESTHYVKALNQGDSLLVVEICVGTYTSTTRSYNYKWQVHLHSNGNIEIVYPDAAGIPTTAPAVSRQCGLCVDATDGWTISASHVATHFTNGTSTTIASGTWPDANRYYRFTRPVISCPATTTPSVVSVSTTEATLSWESMGSEGEWLVSLNGGEWTNVYDTSLTLDTLTGNTLYTFAVRALCGYDDTSSVRMTTFRTACMEISSLPYTYGFEDMNTGSSSTRPEIPCWTHLNNGTSYFGYPYVSSTTPHSGTRNLYWYGSTTTGTYGDYQVVVLPPVDTTIYPINTLRLKFWARPSSTSYYPVFRVGVMTNPTDVSTFQQVATVNVQNVTSWQDFSVMFGNFTGSGNYIAVRLDRPTSSYYVYTDDFTLEEAPTCAPIESHQVVATAGSARITWDIEQGFATDPQGYEVSYSLVSDPSSATTVTTTDRMLTLTGLDADSAYAVSIRSDCGTSYSPAYTFNFTTRALPCLTWDDSNAGPADTLSVGTPGTSTTNGMPVNTGYNYSYCQHLINASEIAHTGPLSISGIAFDYAYSQPMTHATNCMIYMGNTTRTNFTVSSPADSMFVPYSQLTLVYQGPLNCTTNGYNFFQFNQGSFQYDGTSNIVVAIVNNSGSYDGTSYVFRYETTSSGGVGAMTHRVYNNTTPYGPTEMDAARANQSFWRTNMKLVTGGGTCIATASCAAPIATAEMDAAGDIDISWIPGYQETSWDVDYRAVGDSTWTNLVSGTSSTSSTILMSDLLPNTDYEIRVTANCSDSNMATTVHYTTPCSFISIPYTYGFEDMNTGSSTTRPDIPCWHHLNNGSTYYGYPYVSSSTPHNGSRNLYWYATTTTGSYGDYEVVVMPPVNTVTNPINTLQLSFWARPSSTSYAPVFQVGVMTDPTDISTFQTVGTINVDHTTTDWMPYEVVLSSYTGTGRYIAVRANRPTSSWYAYTDDFTIENAPSCPRISDVEAGNITQSDATIYWTASSADAYEVLYGPSGFSFATGTLVDNIFDDSLAITGLQSNTAYDVYVRGICTDDTSNWSYVYTFRTSCGLIDVVPFSEDFENQSTGSSATGTAFIPCWAHLNNGSSYGGYPYVSSSSTYNHTQGGSKGLYWYNSTTTGSYGDYQYIILPGVDTNTYPINTLQLSFWAKSSSTSYSPVFQVGVMNSTSDTSFYLINTINVGNNTEWTEYVTNLSDYPGLGGQYVAIRALRPSSSWYAYVDDVTLDLQPACPRVEDLHATYTGLDSISIAWTDTSTTNSSWVIEYSDVDFIPGTNAVTPITVTDTFFTLTNLDSATTYHIYVYPTCNDYIGYRYLTTATLAASPATVPYVCDFEESGPNGWDLFNAGQTNYWMVGSATNNGGTRSLYITNNGSVNEYTNTSISYSYAVRTLHLGDTGEYAYSYDWKGQGESHNYDFSRIFVTPASEMFAAGSVLGGSTYSFASATAPASWIELTQSGATPNTLAQSSSWQTVTGTFNISTPGNYKIVIAWANDGSGGTNPPTAIDNVSIMHNTCPVVDNLVTTYVGLDSATISWTGQAGHTSFVVEYDSVPFSIGTAGNSISTTDTSYILSGLNAAYTYYVTVRAECSGDTSLGASIHFTTLAGAPATVPYSCDFESNGHGWDLLNGNEGNYWVVGSATNHGGSRSLYITDNGTANSYSGAASYVFATRTFNLAEGNYICSYDWKCNGESSFDFIRVALVPATTILTPGDYSGFNNESAMPAGAIALDGGYRMNLQTNWQTRVDEFPITTAGTYKLVFMWRNDPSVYNLPPAAIDNVQLIINSCPVISNVSATLLSDTISLTWTPGGSETSWEVAVGNTVDVVTTPSYTASGLTPNTDYTVRIRAICGAGDTSMAYTETFHTPCTSASLPYSENFDSYTTSTTAATGVAVNCWDYIMTGTATYQTGSYLPQIYYSSTYAHSGSYSYRLYGEGYHMLPPMPTDLSDLQLTFWDYTTSTSYGLEVGVMEGHTFVPVQTITTPTSTHQQHTVYFGAYTGTSRIIAFRNHYTTSTTTYYSYHYLDNVEVDYLPTCPPVVGIHAVSAGVDNITVDWVDQATSTMAWQIRYGRSGSTATTTVSTTSHPFTISGLDTLTTYTFSVRPICSASDTGTWSQTTALATEMCDNAVAATTGAATGTGYYTPLNNYYNYTLTETIIDSAELDGIGDISAIAYSYAYTTASSEKINVSIWLQPTNKTAFSSSSDLVLLDTTIAVRVYQGNLNCSQGWNYFQFDTTYTWDGHSNLLVIVDDNSGDYDGSSYIFNNSSCTGYKTLAWYSDSYNPDPTSSTYDGSKSYYQYRATMKLVSCNGLSCRIPEVVSLNADETSATFQWRGNATAYEVAIAAGNWVEPTTATTVAGNTYTFEGLTPTTRYSVGVRAVCDEAEGIYSEWVVDTVTTAEQPCPAPTGVTVSDVALTGATISWTPASATQNDFEVNITAVGVDTIVSATGTSVTVTGLPHNTDYVVKVRANCGYGTYSDWSETATFHTLDCQTVTGVTVTETTQTTASVSWTSNGSASYEVAYGIVGTTTDQCARMTVTTNSCVITGLEPGVSYVVYVRSVCAEGVVSEEWSTGNNFTTQDEVGIADVDNASISLYPNPATSTVTLTGIEGEAEVSVVDMNGRQVYSGSVKEGSLSIDVSGLSQGAYFVRVTGEKVNAIRKLIVR